MKPPHQNRPGNRSSGGPRRPGGPGEGQDRNHQDRNRSVGPRPSRPYGEGKGAGPRGSGPRGAAPHGDEGHGGGPRGAAPHGSAPRGGFGAHRPEREGFREGRSRDDRPGREFGPRRPEGGAEGREARPARREEGRFQQDRPARVFSQRRPEGGAEGREARPARREEGRFQQDRPARVFSQRRPEGGAEGREARPVRREEGRFQQDRPVREFAPRRAEGEAEGREVRSARHEEAPRPRHALEAPSGSVWLYGTHAVAAALANPSRRLRRLLLTEEAAANLKARLAPPWPLTPERVERGRLEHLLGRDVVHQGAALLVDPLTPPTLAQVMERGGPVLVLDQVSDPRNVGAILRSAQAFGVAAVIVQERNAPEETGTLAKAASGALEKVPLLRAVNISRTLVALRAAGCWVVGLDASGGPLSGAALAGRRVALVLGSEGEGLRRLTRETCDELAGISMPGADGGLDSLNVSAATAVALYELGRRA